MHFLTKLLQYFKIGIPYAKSASEHQFETYRERSHISTIYTTLNLMRLFMFKF